MDEQRSSGNTVDALTGLYTRREFERLMRAESARVNRYGGPLALVVFEIDGFQQIKRRLGEQGTDDLLRRIGDVLAHHVRTADVLAHWSGPRFTVLAPGLDIYQVTGFAVKLRRLLSEYRFNGSGLIQVSLGVTEYRRGESTDDFFDRALRAMSHARANGGNRVSAARADE